MATTTYGSPYVAGTDLVSGWPAASQTVADRIDDVAMKGNGVNAITSAGYTTVLTDAGKLVTLSHASAQNLTLPLNSSVAYETGTTIETLTIGAGTWTVTPTGGVTYTGTTSLPTGTRLRMTKTGTDTWYGSVLGGGGLSIITPTSIANSGGSSSASGGAVTFTGVTSISLNGVFTGSYENYLVVVSGVSSLTSPTPWYFRYRVAGTDATATDYYHGGTYVTATAGPTRDYAGSATGQIIGFAADFGKSMGQATVCGPALAAATPYVAQYAAPGSVAAFYGTDSGMHGLATAYDGFTIYVSSGTTTGKVRVYGMQSS